MGLGNPGPEYRDTRHNAGFVLAEAAVERWRFPRFARGRRIRWTEGTVQGEAVRVVEPLTYMNRTGAVVAGIVAETGFDMTRDLLILVDDFALPVGGFRLRPRGSSGGHNGLESIESALRSREYPRLRIGVGPAPAGAEWSDFVLNPFEREEREILEDLLPRLVDAVECWLLEGIEIAMTRFNQRGTT